MSTSITISQIEVVDEGKTKIPIRTGIGFMDHMIDQWNSHAQVGVGIVVHEATDDHNYFGGMGPQCQQQQKELCTAVGTVLGTALYNSILQLKQQQRQLDDNGNLDPSVESRFCCPLDEALVECRLRLVKEDDGATSQGRLVQYQLAPYGKYPTSTGRSRIGCWETEAIEEFWKALAISAKLELALIKIRGDNGHHIVESSFKAFSRALRQWLDVPTIFAPQSDNDSASVALSRSGTIQRSTKETNIAVQLLLNGCTDLKEINVQTGIPMLDQFVTALCQSAQISCQINCHGDLWVDDHHTTEDVSIAIGQCLTEALGTKAGLNRMGVARAQVGTALVEVTMDLSNRPYLGHNLHETLGRNEEMVDGMSCEMMEHMLDSLVMNGRMTVHIVELPHSQVGTVATVKDTMLATAQAMGEALRVCAMVDQRRAGQTASSKGTLSV